MNDFCIDIFTEAGTVFGYGHLMRCQALAEGFLDQHFSVRLFVRGDVDYEQFKDGKYEIHCFDWLEKLDWIGMINSALAVIDSYHTGETHCRFFWGNYDQVLFLDDCNRGVYPGGIVLNGVLGADMIDYPEIKGLDYLLGPEYQPLRSPFWEQEPHLIKQKITDILITFGGSDIRNLTGFYMDKMKILAPQAELHVVIGKGFSVEHLREIEEKADSNISLHKDLSAEEMKHLMQKCDLAVSAAGQTISELACCGVPTIGIKVIENQGLNYQNWKKTGFLFDNNLHNINISYSERKKRSRLGQILVDGQGVRRVVVKMTSFFLKRQCK